MNKTIKKTRERERVMRARAVSKPERSLINKYSNLERYTRSSSIMVSSSIQAIDDTSRYFFLPSNGNGSRVLFSFQKNSFFFVRVRFM